VSWGAVPETVSTFTLKTLAVLNQFSGARSQLYCQTCVYIAALQPTLLFNRVHVNSQNGKIHRTGSFCPRDSLVLCNLTCELGEGG
jgi:hypothetical protein